MPDGSTSERGRSTGIGGKSEKPIGEAFGELMKGVTFSARMAANLTMVEDQRQSIGKKADHGEHHQGGGLVDGGVFEVTVDGESVKDFGIDSPTTATELMNEQGRDRTEFEIGGIEVGAGLRHRDLGFAAMTVFFADPDPLQVFEANGFDDPHPAISDRPIEVRQVPVLNLPAGFGLNSWRSLLRATLGLAQ